MALHGYPLPFIVFPFSLSGAVVANNLAHYLFTVTNMLNKLQGQPASYDKKYGKYPRQSLVLYIYLYRLT